MASGTKEKILRFLRESNLTPGNVLLVCVTFWLTVLITRGAIFWSVLNGSLPAIFVRGFHLHHFITGFFLLVVALALLSKKIFSRYIPLALLGCGLGFLIDEFLYWTVWRFDYWSLYNLLAVIVIGMSMAMVYVYAKRDDLAKKYGFGLRLDMHLRLPRGPKWKTVILPFSLVAIVLIAMYSFHHLKAEKLIDAKVKSVPMQVQE